MSDKEENEANHEPLWKTMTAEELPYEYSPTRWSRRYPEDQIIQEHVKIVAKSSQAAREKVKVRLDVRYGEGPLALLDVYGEDLPDESPVFVYVHGGYWQWQEGGKHISASMVQPLHRHGVLTVVIGYDIAPQVSVETMVERIEKGVSWACKLGRARGSVGVVLAGWSAGAQLVTMVLSRCVGNEEPDLNLVRGVVTLSGIFDLRPLVSTHINQPLNLTTSSAWTLSPLRCANQLGSTWSEKGLKLLVTVGQYDPHEFQRQARQYSRACEEAGLESEVMLVEGVDHFNIIEDLEKADFALTRRIIQFVITATKPKDE